MLTYRVSLGTAFSSQCNDASEAAVAPPQTLNTGHQQSHDETAQIVTGPESVGIVGICYTKVIIIECKDFRSFNKGKFQYLQCTEEEAHLRYCEYSCFFQY